jgi:hypothetical protein
MISVTHLYAYTTVPEPSPIVKTGPDPAPNDAELLPPQHELNVVVLLVVVVCLPWRKTLTKQGLPIGTEISLQKCSEGNP